MHIINITQLVQMVKMSAQWNLGRIMYSFQQAMKKILCKTFFQELVTCKKSNYSNYQCRRIATLLIPKFPVKYIYVLYDQLHLW